MITVNRPEARNAVNSAVGTAVGDALEQAQEDPDVRAVVSPVTVIELRRSRSQGHRPRGEPVSPRPRRVGIRGICPLIAKPTIAAVNGNARSLAAPSLAWPATWWSPRRREVRFAGSETRTHRRRGRGVPHRRTATARWRSSCCSPAIRCLRPTRRGVGIGQRCGAGRRGCCRPARRWPSGSPSMRRCRCRPAIGWPTASTTVLSTARYQVGRDHPRDQHAAEVRGCQGGTAGVRREASARLEGTLMKRLIFEPEHERSGRPPASTSSANWCPTPRVGAGSDR